MVWRFLFCHEFLMQPRKEKIMNSPDKSQVNLWDKWLKATGVNAGYGYRVPQEVWDAAWNGNWPDDEGTIQWIVQEYLDVEEAKACGYLEIIIPLRQQAEAALNAAKRHRQVKIDADIDEVIKIIRGLGRESDERPAAPGKCGEKLSRRRDRWMQSIKTAIMAVTALTVSTFLVSNYKSHPLNYAADAVIARSPEIRRAIPVEPEIRRAIPLEPKIRKAIPAQTSHNRNQSGSSRNLHTAMKK
jgi:hypothetical protein